MKLEGEEVQIEPLWNRGSCFDYIFFLAPPPLPSA